MGILDIFKGASASTGQAPELEIATQGVNDQQYDGNDRAKIEAMITDLTKYQGDKAMLDSKVIENESWYMSRHWEIIRKAQKEDAPDPVTAYLFNTIANKHADIMDNFPSANILAREPSDVAEAEKLKSIVPAIMEIINYQDTYSDGAWEKLKHGFAVYSVLWDTEAENGLGEISVNLLDALNVFWEPGIKSIQKSKRVFVTNLMDREEIVAQYPFLDGDKIRGAKAITQKQYSIDSSKDITDLVLLIDCYYYVYVGGKKVIHYAKFIDGNNIIYMSEKDPVYAETGYYDHGMQPFEIDVLFPEKESPVGFGFIDILKSPQMYIDKLDEIISVNSMKAGKIRWMAKQDAFVNINDVQDYSKDIIETTKDVNDENIKAFQARPLPGFIVTHRENKINELKEVSGANDFNRGEGSSGITAASAIAMLQEAGNKLSRDMIATSYRRTTGIYYLVIELARQFYDDARSFRITGENGEYQYTQYSNAGIKDQPIQLPGLQMDPAMSMGVYADIAGMGPNEMMYRKPVFDIKVIPEKKSPFSQAAHNELAKEMFAMGLFSPERAEEAQVALEMMSFEGKDKIAQMVQKNSAMLQALQQIKAQQEQMNAENYKLRAIVQATTGKDMSVDLNGLSQQSQQPQAVPEGVING